MRIEITKQLVIKALSLSASIEDEMTFAAGQYPAKFTPEGKIEIVQAAGGKASLSFSQFRERLSIGDFVLIEA